MDKENQKRIYDWYIEYVELFALLLEWVIENINAAGWEIRFIIE